MHAAAAAGDKVDKVVDRPKTRFGSERLAAVLGGIEEAGGVWVEVEGAGDVEEARGTFGVGPGGGTLSVVSGSLAGRVGLFTHFSR